MERTLVLIKPDGVKRALIGEIIKRFESPGLKVVGLKIMKVDKKLAEAHYTDDEEWLLSVGNKALNSYKEKGIAMKDTAKEIGVRIRSYLIKYLLGGPVVALVMEGNAAIDVVRKMTGGTEPRKADPYSIRGSFSSDTYQFADNSHRPILNLIHASEDQKTAEKEIKLWFKDSELVSYKRADEEAMFSI